MAPIYGAKNILGKNLRAIAFLAEKYFLVPGKYWVKKIGVLKFWGKKFFLGPKIFGVKFLETFLTPKKLRQKKF